MTDQTAAPEKVRLRYAVGSTASALQGSYLGERGEKARSDARRTLADLRRHAGTPAEKSPLAFQVALDSMSPPLESSDLGRGDAPSASERSAFDALSLFALHMQSAKGPSVHVQGRSFGAAVGMLASGRESSSIRPRFEALMAARSDRMRLIQLRNLVTLLRADQIGLDYGALAEDLRTLASSKRNGVLLRWGRDFSRSARPKTDNND